MLQLVLVRRTGVHHSVSSRKAWAVFMYERGDSNVYWANVNIPRSFGKKLPVCLYNDYIVLRRTVSFYRLERRTLQEVVHKAHVWPATNS